MHSMHKQPDEVRGISIEGIISNIKQFALLEKPESLRELVGYLDENYDAKFTNVEVRHILENCPDFVYAKRKWDLTLEIRSNLIESYVMTFLESGPKTTDEIIACFDEETYEMEEGRIVKALQISDNIVQVDKKWDFAYNNKNFSIIDEKLDTAAEDLERIASGTLELRSELKEKYIEPAPEIISRAPAIETKMDPKTDLKPQTMLHDFSYSVYQEPEASSQMYSEQTYNSDPYLDITWVETVDKLKEVIRLMTARTWEITAEDSLMIAQVVVGFFGSQDRIIDNVLEKEERELFGELQFLTDDSVFREYSEETTLWDGGEWRSHYWQLNFEKMDRAIARYEQELQAKAEESGVIEDSELYDDVFNSHSYRAAKAIALARQAVDS